MLQPLHGGAAARPFVTHSNALDIDLYLRIALELYLKRLVVGGIERVYEIGRNFRNEGVDSSHNPEFTMLEFYEAYGDYDSMAERTRALVVAAAEAVGGTVVPDGQGGEIDLAAPWRVRTVHEAVSEATGASVDAGTPVEELRRVAEKAGVSLQPSWNAGQVLLELYEQLVEGADPRADLLPGLPRGGLPAGPPAPRRPAADRTVGPRRPRPRARHRLFGAGRPGRAAPSPDRAVPPRRGRRRGGHAARRGLPDAPSSTRCRPPAAWASGSTGCSCS